MPVTDDEANPARGALGAVEKLLGAAAVLGAALYVLINALYIEFYDDFGVRPEQVGFDRLAVLARSAWVALLAALIGGSALGMSHTFRTISAWMHAKASRRWGDGQSPQSWLGLGSLLILGAFGIIYLLLQARVEAEADRVAQGETSNGIGGTVPFIDVRASRAEATWVNPDKTSPPGLVDAPYLIYLGSDGEVTVLVACGRTTYIVQSSDVAVILLEQGSDTRETDEAQVAAFQEACG